MVIPNNDENHEFSDENIYENFLDSCFRRKELRTANALRNLIDNINTSNSDAQVLSMIVYFFTYVCICLSVSAKSASTRRNLINIILYPNADARFCHVFTYVSIINSCLQKVFTPPRPMRGCVFKYPHTAVFVRVLT